MNAVASPTAANLYAALAAGDIQLFQHHQVVKIGGCLQPLLGAMASVPARISWASI